jgi:uncharacterized membrane protein
MAILTFILICAGAVLTGTAGFRQIIRKRRGQPTSNLLVRLTALGGVIMVGAIVLFLAFYGR